MARSVRIMVADDHAVLRSSMVELLNSQPGWEIVGEAEDGAMAVEMAHLLRPDVIVMDYEMPKMNGAEATKQIAQGSVNVQVIGFSLHTANEKRKEMLEAGAASVVSKSDPPSVLLEAI
jgi:DNA-binding NarL/FixJ family response regulator